MEDSIFTKIINGDIPSHKIYEDEHTYAFLDINPASEGHTLVVPKSQVEFVWDLDDDTYTALTCSVKKIAKHLREVTGKHVGELVVGVDVPHAHIHLVPFSTPGDIRNAIGTPASEPDHEALALVAKRLALPE